MPSGHTQPISFDDERFFLEVNAFVEELEETLDTGLLDRAWQITLGTVQVHAEVDVDLDEGETLEKAESLVWYDLWQAFESEPATFTLWGLYEELLLACGEHRDRFSDFLCAAGRRAFEAPPEKKKTRKTRSKKAPSAGPKAPAEASTRGPDGGGDDRPPIRRGHLTLLR